MTTLGAQPVPAAGRGWTNAYPAAEGRARAWHAGIGAAGIRDVDLELPGRAVPGDGRWRFAFRHRITGVRVHLDVHGVDDVDAFRRELSPAGLEPRAYWEGEGTGPDPDDWAADGFEAVKTFRPAGGLPCDAAMDVRVVHRLGLVDMAEVLCRHVAACPPGDRVDPATPDGALDVVRDTLAIDGEGWDGWRREIHPALTAADVVRVAYGWARRLLGPLFGDVQRAALADRLAMELPPGTP